MKNIVEQAIEFAGNAHRNQTRKYTKEPYIVHPRKVGRIVATVNKDAKVVAAAILHDVVEDTPVTIEEIENEFGKRVAKLVAEVTDLPAPKGSTRDERVARNRGHLSHASPEGQTIKLADIIHNTRDIAEHDPKFAKRYMKEKRDQLTVLKQGDKSLFYKALCIIGSYYGEHF
jgi:(p)ppGpp synthase/HD superfamily hydrolase